MIHPKAMGIGAMFVLLVVAIVILPMLVQFIDRNEAHFVISGFQNMESNVMYRVPSVVASTAPASYTPDRNTKYLCRSPNDSGIPCEEGTFCDGTTNRCVKNFPPSDINLNDGYYS